MNIVDLLINVGLPISSGIGGWFVGKKMRKATIENAELKNVKAAQSIYIQTIKDISEHITYLEKRLNDISKERSQLREDLLDYKVKVNSMKKRIDQLEAKLKGYEKKGVKK